jgi:CheY-like chemotaxis protein
MAQARILIAEDEGIVALDLAIQLRALGHRVVATVKSGEQAVHQAMQTDPDLILMDIRLQGEMDGIRAADAIVAQLDIPVLFCSALEDEGTMRRVRAVKHAGHIVKPFSRERLHSAIENALGSTGVSLAQEMPDRRAKED